MHSAAIVINSVFYDGNKYYPQVRMDEIFYELAE